MSPSTIDLETQFRVQRHLLEQTNGNHIPVVCTIKVCLRKLKHAVPDTKLQWNLLQENAQMKTKYVVEVHNRFAALESDQVSKLEVLKEALVETAKELIPLIKRDKKNEWMKKEILEMMEEKQKVRNEDSDQYHSLNGNFRNKCREAKE